MTSAFGTPPVHDLSSRVASLVPASKGLYWGGEWHTPVGARMFDTINPSTGARLGAVFEATPHDVDAAVAAARTAFPAWAATPPLERARRLREAAARIRANALDLALLDAANCGNPVGAMRADAEIAATQLEYFAGLVLEVKGETLPTGNGSLNYTVREPLGVIARIFPFNHPFMFAAGKIAAPLAAGNTVIVKPPEQAPLSTVRLMELLADLFPPGVLNCVTGGRDTGAALAAHPGIAAIALIGSVPAGKAVLHAAADTMKHALLELGGKNAMIVFPDADFDKAVAGAARGMNFTWCGQSCGSTSRLFVEDSIHDRFVEALAVRVKDSYVPGPATDLRTTMGALASKAQFDRTMRYIRAGVEEGARLVCGGKRPDDPRLEGGLFVEPTIFADVDASMSIAREEIFGPVLSVMRWRDEAQLFDAVNALELGLTASIWTTSLKTAHRGAARVEAGYVWINDCSIHIPGAPFGGYKQSGIGREESKEELYEFTRLKNVNVALAD
ncbi:2-formylbenzoate dehydrogenase [Paraburkholderia kururiensis]|uniref:aldehyde dehydrogenase family protein n=1 Tax=Paraburkholderia kururiensis TaxID=984307 RepID=UPI0039A5B0A8